MKIKSLGFTLIELLIVIAILGILAAGILVAIDPVDKISAANDAKVQNDISGAGRAAEAYAAVNNGFYPSALSELMTFGELKRPPVAPSGYPAYEVIMVPNPCVSGTVFSGTGCTGIIITGRLRSKKYSAFGKQVWRYESSSGKSCAVATATATDVCP